MILIVKQLIYRLFLIFKPTRISSASNVNTNKERSERPLTSTAIRVSVHFNRLYFSNNQFSDDSKILILILILINICFLILKIDSMNFPLHKRSTTPLGLASSNKGIYSYNSYTSYEFNFLKFFITFI